MEGIVLGLCVMLIWGVADFIQAIPIRKIGTMKSLYFFNLFSILLILPTFVFFLFKGQISLTLKDLGIIVIASLIDAVAYYNFTKAFEIGEVAIAAPISAAYPILTVISAVLFLKETVTLIKVISVIVIVVGIALASTDLKRLKHLHTVNGVKEAFIAMLSWGIYFAIIGGTMKQLNFVTAFCMSWLIISAIVFLFSAFKIGLQKVHDLKKQNIFSQIVIATIMYMAAWLLFNLGVKNTDLSLLVPVSSLYPAVTVILAVIFFKEKLALNQKLGILIILGGLYLISI